MEKSQPPPPNNHTMTMRHRPNILITGTPGTGKTTLASLLGEEDEFVHIDVPALIKDHACYEGRDEARDSDILDEDKLLDLLETMFEEQEERRNIVVVDFHLCEIFPERWFDLIIVLRTNTEVLFDRLTARGYNDLKRRENMECEIMQVVLDAAMESYDGSMVHECPSNTMEDLEIAAQRVSDWTKEWIFDNEDDDSNDDN